ncbi:MAG TPA: hypothetical protein VFA89_15400 [Terriglobales bacterium]|nr:hypothetical protein [Terriglobales bacterium]
MRFYEGDFAYEIEKILDPSTQVSKGWRYNIYRVRPTDQLLRSGEAATKEEAEEAGRRALAATVKEAQGQGPPGSRAA